MSNLNLKIITKTGPRISAKSSFSKLNDIACPVRQRCSRCQLPAKHICVAALIRFVLRLLLVRMDTLAKRLEDDYPNFDEDEADICLVLRSYESSNTKRAILSEKYTDVFLIFDFGPQHDSPYNSITLNFRIKSHLPTIFPKICFFPSSYRWITTMTVSPVLKSESS